MIDGFVGKTDTFAGLNDPIARDELAVLPHDGGEFVVGVGRREGLLLAVFGFGREEPRATKIDQRRDAGTIRLGEPLDPARCGVFECEAFEQSLGEDAREEALCVAILCGRGRCHFDERGFGADASGVAVEGVVVDARGVEVESAVDGSEAFGAAIDDGDVDFASERGVESAVDEAVGLGCGGEVGGGLRRRMCLRCGIHVQLLTSSCLAWFCTVFQGVQNGAKRANFFPSLGTGLVGPVGIGDVRRLDRGIGEANTFGALARHSDTSRPIPHYDGGRCHQHRVCGNSAIIIETNRATMARTKM